MLIGKHTIGTVAYMGGVPALLEGFVWSWTQMVQYNSQYVCGPDEEIHYERSKLSYHATARNELAQNMKGDWLFMVDADHAFDADILHRMLNTMSRYSVDVLTGLYVTKSQPHTPVIYIWDEAHGAYSPVAKWQTDERIFEIGGCGGGCLLVRRSVFERIYVELNEKPFSVNGFSEDLSFCARLRRLGIKVFCDPEIQSLHIATVGVHYGMTPIEYIVNGEGYRVEVEAR